jgi:hypothetical protein
MEKFIITHGESVKKGGEDLQSEMKISEEEYKQAKIAFVSNLSGSSRYDLFVVFAVAAVRLHFFSTLTILTLLSTIHIYILHYTSIITPLLLFSQSHRYVQYSTTPLHHVLHPRKESLGLFWR